jgi:hypothetical protein
MEEPVFDIDWNKCVIKDTWWHRVKRKIFAKPYYCINEGYITFWWVWESGGIEIVECKEVKPNEAVLMPKGMNKAIRVTGDRYGRK